MARNCNLQNDRPSTSHARASEWRAAEADAMSTDALSDVLRAVRLRGAVFFSVTATSPWVAEAPPARAVGPRILPGVDHVIEYHLVTSGRCYGGLIEEPPVLLEAGDVIVFPQGDAHVMSSAPGMRGPLDMHMHGPPRGQQLPIFIQKDGGGPEGAHVVCGFLGCDARPFNPLLSALPRVLHVRPRSPGDRIVGQLIALALAESSAPRPGGECALARLSELLFIEVVRRRIEDLPAEATGWLGGLRDPAVGRALTELHDRPSHEWTLEELARHSGMSRSGFAERFTQFAGMPPMQYLTHWRMQLAAGMLADGRATNAEIADRIGYRSEAAFSRAFKKVVGVPPVTFRLGKRSAAEKGDPAALPLDALDA
jgi:AraC-like DNA-binding protein